MGTSAIAQNTAGGMRIDMIGVPFDGMGRSPGQADAPAALRAAGLSAALGPDVLLEPDLALSAQLDQRAVGSGLLNEQALLQMVEALHHRVRSSLAAGRFPFVYGADCSVLLAAIPALVDIDGRACLLFVDGHEDATTMDLSPNGEAANMEIALLMGLTGERVPQPLRDRLPALAADAVAMLGPRDQLFRQAANVPTIADRVWLRPADEVAADPAGCARRAVEHVKPHGSRWWLHIDLDVLRHSDFAACGAPGEVVLDGGLTWQQLTDLGLSAMRSGGCAGWSLSVYNPDLDPDRSAAQSIVEFVAHIAPAVGR